MTTQNTNPAASGHIFMDTDNSDDDFSETRNRSIIFVINMSDAEYGDDDDGDDNADEKNNDNDEYVSVPGQCDRNFSEALRAHLRREMLDEHDDDNDDENDIDEYVKEPGLCDGSFSDALNRTLQAHLRRQMLCREISNHEEDSEVDTVEEVTDHTPSVYRDLMRSPEHFRCELCDSNLEIMPNYEFVTHDDILFSKLTGGQFETDLYCPECGWTRGGYFSNKVHDF